MDIIEVFSRFNLDLLPKTWVKTLWNNNFDAIVQLPPDYESQFIESEFLDLLNYTCDFLKKWVENPHATLNISLKTLSVNRHSINLSAKSWRHLIDNGVQHKALVCLLSVFISKGRMECRATDLKSNYICLKATHLYLLLLSIPDSIMFQVFNPILYSHAIDSLKMCSVINFDSVDKSRNKKKTRNKGGGKKIQQDSGSEDELGLHSVEDDAAEKKALLILLNSVLLDFIFVLQHFYYKNQKDSLVLTIQVLVLITRMEQNLPSAVLTKPSANTVSALVFNGYHALITLCKNNNTQDTVRSMLKQFLEGLLGSFNNRTLLTEQKFEIIKVHTIKFIRSISTMIKRSSLELVETFIQHLCFRSPDRAEIRAKVIEISIEIITSLPCESVDRLLIFLMKLCFNEHISSRIIALDMIYKCILMRDNLRNGCRQDEGSEDISLHPFLLSAIFTRCADTSANVSSKALTILGNIISSNCCKQEIEQIFVFPYEENRVESFKLKEYLITSSTLTDEVNPLPKPKYVMNVVEDAAHSSKVLVRKAALQVLTNIFLLNEKWMTLGLLKFMVKECCDNAVSVRKLMVKNFTDLVTKYPTNPELANCWVMGILPLMCDEDNGVQEKAAEVIRSTIIVNLVPFEELSSPSHYLPWLILENIVSGKMMKGFSIACRQFATSNSINSDLFECLKTYIGTDYNSLSWYFICTLLEHSEIHDPLFIKDYFFDNIYNNLQLDEFCVEIVTEALFKTVNIFQKSDQDYLLDKLLEALSDFVVPLPIIARYIDICNVISNLDQFVSDSEIRTVEEWTADILQIGEGKLERRIGPSAPLEIDDEKLLLQVIFTIGELSQISCRFLSGKITSLLRSLLDKNSQAHNDNDTWQGEASLIVKRLSIITLGKLCMQDEESASSIVPLIGHLLSTTQDIGTKINSMIALTDLCIKFTSLVERYLPEMYLSLNDSDLTVRLQTLTLIVKLVQEDYLKLRCPLFFHLLYLLNDSNDEIRDKTVAFIIHTVLKKNSKIMIQNFIEALYYYNQYDNHPVFSKTPMTEKEKTVFPLAGYKYTNKRRVIYKFMLKHMDDDHRFQIMYKLCVDVLDQVVEEDVILNASGKCLLQDALHMLVSEDIRMSYLRKTNKDNDEEENKIFDLNNFAKKALLTEVMKKNVIQNILPIILRLKAKLYQLKSTLHKDLMICLRDLMKDYKKEIDEIFADDPDTAAEVAYDLRKCADDSSEECDAEKQLQMEMMKEVVIQSIINCEELKGTRVQAVTASTFDMMPISDEADVPSPPVMTSQRRLTSPKHLSSIINTFMEHPISPMAKSSRQNAKKGSTKTRKRPTKSPKPSTSKTPVEDIEHLSDDLLSDEC